MANPTITSREILADGLTIRRTFSRAVTIQTGELGMILSASGGFVSPSFPTGAGVTTIDATLSRVVERGETVTESYFPLGGSDITADDTGEPLFGYTAAPVTNNSEQPTTTDRAHLFRLPGRRNSYTVRADMPRGPVDSHYAVNVLDLFTFSDKPIVVPCENLLHGRTLASVELVSQSNDADPAADDISVTAVTVLSAEADVYEGTRVIDTIPASTGFSFRTSGGGEATYALTFSWEDSEGDTDGITVRVNVR